MKVESVEGRTDIVLGLGQMHVARGEDAVLVCLGLGSCVALCAYDPQAKVGGMVHMVLPSSRESRGTPGPKFVDHAIPKLVQDMEQLGASRSRMTIKIAGGAQMVKTNGASPLLKIGDRNVEAARAVLAELGLPLHGEETGGTHGRSARLFLDTGKLLVADAGGASHEL